MNTFHYYPLTSSPSRRDDQPVATYHALPNHDRQIPDASLSASPSAAASTGSSPLGGYYATATTGCRMPTVGHPNAVIDGYAPAPIVSPAAAHGFYGPYYGMYQPYYPVTSGHQSAYEMFSSTHQVQSPWTDCTSDGTHHHPMQSSAAAIYRSFVDAESLRCHQQQQQQQSVVADENFNTGHGSDVISRLSFSCLSGVKLGDKGDIDQSVRHYEQHKQQRRHQQQGKCRSMQQLVPPPKAKVISADDRQPAATRNLSLTTSRMHCSTAAGIINSAELKRSSGRPQMDVGHGSSDSLSVSSLGDDSEDVSCTVAAAAAAFAFHRSHYGPGTTNFLPVQTSTSASFGFPATYISAVNSDDLLKVIPASGEKLDLYHE
jgi:hypothetical protein